MLNDCIFEIVLRNFISKYIHLYKDKTYSKLTCAQLTSNSRYYGHYTITPS